jgi:hypothetical protein
MYIQCVQGLSVQAQYSRLCHISSSFRYNSSLVSWTVVCLTAAKFKRVTQSQIHIATDGQSISLSWCRGPVFLGRPLWREGGSCVYAAGPRQRSVSRVPVPWDSWPTFTVSDLRLPFRRLLRVAGLRWRYSTPPPHGCLLVLVIQRRHGLHRKRLFHYCVLSLQEKRATEL